MRKLICIFAAICLLSGSSVLASSQNGHVRIYSSTDQGNYNCGNGYVTKATVVAGGYKIEVRLRNSLVQTDFIDGQAQYETDSCDVESYTNVIRFY